MMWYKDSSGGIVVSTRIRLARNIKNTTFPMFMKPEEREAAAQKLTDAIVGGNSVLAKDFSVHTLDNMTPEEIRAMTEEHLISPDMAQNKGGRVLLNSDKTMSIMLMEEDHIRLQIIKSGYDLDGAYELADKVDDVIEENVDYAFDKDFGFLTSCPTNVGTGMRASVMMHLPALAMTGNISRVLRSALNAGIAVRGLYGEGSESHGNLYQFSNRTTTGASEKEIIAKLKDIADTIISLEKQARDTIAEKNKPALEDRVWRSYGTLKYARSMSSDEAKKLLSDVMLGMDMGIIDSSTNALELMVLTEPAQVMAAQGKRLDAAERDAARAALIREKLA